MQEQQQTQKQIPFEEDNQKSKYAAGRLSIAVSL